MAKKSLLSSLTGTDMKNLVAEVNEKIENEQAEAAAKGDSKKPGEATVVGKIDAAQMHIVLGKSDEGKYFVKNANRFPKEKKITKVFEKIALLEATDANLLKVRELVTNAGLTLSPKMTSLAATIAEGNKKPAPPQFVPEKFENIPVGMKGELQSFIQARPQTKPQGELILVMMERVVEKPSKKNPAKMKKHTEVAYLLTECVKVDETNGYAYLVEINTGDCNIIKSEQIKKRELWGVKQTGVDPDTKAPIVEPDPTQIIGKMYVVKPMKTEPAKQETPPAEQTAASTQTTTPTDPKPPKKKQEKPAEGESK